MLSSREAAILCLPNLNPKKYMGSILYLINEGFIVLAWEGLPMMWTLTPSGEIAVDCMRRRNAMRSLYGDRAWLVCDEEGRLSWV